MTMRLGAVGCVLVMSVASLQAQPWQPEDNPIFDDTDLASVFIEIQPADLQRLFSNPHSDTEHLGRFTYDDGITRTVIDSIGFRLRGNTSRDAQKKSFKVSFNTFVRGQKFQGLEKLNLNGEHNDPSIIRSKLSWDLFAAMGVPGSRANHVKLYVNDTYYGLYVNVEQIDEHFLNSRFGSSGGFLYKCLWPANLTYLGDDPTLYHPQTSERRPYDLKLRDSDAEGYHDLAHFIDILNNTPDADFQEAIEEVFEVNGFLKWMAVNVLVGMWDDYWFNQNNYYLYSDPQTGRFHFIPFDYDNTFGIDWFGIDWGERNVYTFGEPPLTDGDRPLARRILNIPAYRDRYTFYLRQALNGPFSIGTMQSHVQALRSLITPAIEDDPFRSLDYGWSTDDFNRSFTSRLGDHVTYGVSPYINTRWGTAISQLDNVNVPPILSYLNHTLEGSQLTVSLLVEDEEVSSSVTLTLRPETGDALTYTLHDDGLHNDRAAGDGVYAALLTDLPDAFTYTVTATDVSGQQSTSHPQRVRLTGNAGPLVINELMADNGNTIADETGSYDDWVELYNAGSAPVSLLGISLSDDPNEPGRWLLPDVTVEPGTHILLWTDGDSNEGPLHGPFRLSRNGEELGLYQQDGTTFTLLDRVVFGPQDEDASFGRSPDGSTTLGTLLQPTPGTANVAIAISNDTPGALTEYPTLSTYPNPFVDHATIHLDLPQSSHVHLEVYDVVGRRLTRLSDATLYAGLHRFSFDGAQAHGHALPAGMYFIHATVRTGDTLTRLSTAMTLLK